MNGHFYNLPHRQFINSWNRNSVFEDFAFIHRAVYNYWDSIPRSFSKQDSRKTTTGETSKAVTLRVSIRHPWSGGGGARKLGRAFLKVSHSGTGERARSFSSTPCTLPLMPAAVAETMQNSLRELKWNDPPGAWCCGEKTLKQWTRPQVLNVLK
jgi:hypothetical protein